MDKHLEDPFGVKKYIDTGIGRVTLYHLERLEESGLGRVLRLPYSIRILLESLLRQVDGHLITEEDVKFLAQWDTEKRRDRAIPFIPARVILQDFTGVPAIVDLAAMRSTMKRLGGDPKRINPLIPADMVIDHSIQVDYYGTSDARIKNEAQEFERNRERYALLHWAQGAFTNLRVFPPGRGIVHQVNLEYLASVIQLRNIDGKLLAYPDSLVGTDSHTTMINGLGVLGWGVGGIEAEAVMLGQPYYMTVPDVVGVKLSGELEEGVTATDLVLTITQLLRKHGVVGKFVEFFGPGMEKLSLPDRATISNMAPEYGATAAYFPIDAQTIRYLQETGRDPLYVKFITAYAQEQGLFEFGTSSDIIFTETVELDMNTVETSLAGPKRPQDRIAMRNVPENFHRFLKSLGRKESGSPAVMDGEYHRWLVDGGNCEESIAINKCDRLTIHTIGLELSGEKVHLNHGSIVIAAITSCTNTSNPSVMIGAGLLAKKAVERGLKVKPYIKTSLAPGSRVVIDYLKAAGLLSYLEMLGFYLVGFGCTTCIGNSGPLTKEVVKAIKENELVVAAVLSGNRNFEGRIHSLVKANYLASPLLVIAYALAGSVNVNLKDEPLGHDPQGRPIFLQEIWPQEKEIQHIMKKTLSPEMVLQGYLNVFEGTEEWKNLGTSKSHLFKWDPKSTYIREPPFFTDFQIIPPPKDDIIGARVLALLDDSITTDHISPAGAIPPSSPAGQYLISHEVASGDFNSYGSRRGNHEVMMRGTFGNIRLRNHLVPGREGGWTSYHPKGEEITIYDATMLYQKNNIPLLIIAGKEYGTGSSRDWAAKGTRLLGVKAVIAESYERIHRGNLIGMGILPLQFKEGESASTSNINGDEIFDIKELKDLTPKKELEVTIRSKKGEKRLQVISRLDTPVEIEYYRNDGILHTVLKNMLKKG